MRWLHFLLSHSLFIAFCAVALCYQSYTLLSVSPNNAVYAFVFCSTLASYNFYWLVSKFSFSRHRSMQTFMLQNSSYIIFLFIAAAGMILAGKYIAHLYPYIGIAILLTLVYSLPLWPFQFAKQMAKAGLLKPVILAFTWTFVTIVFPLYPVLETELLPVLTLFVARFFFMMILCMIFDMRDEHLDKQHAFHSLATDLDRNSLRIIMYILFAGYLLAGVWLRVNLHDRAQVIAFLACGILAAILFWYSLKKQGYIFYYFMVDGMMVVSAFFTWLAQLAQSR